MQPINPLEMSPVAILKGHTAPIYVAKFNRDGQYVLTGSQDRSIKLWNPYKELLIKSYSGVHNYEVTDVAVTDDNARFISVGGDKVGFVWDVATGKVIRKFGSHHSRINCCAIGGESAVVATGGYDCEIRIWDLKNKKESNCIQKIKECKDSVSSIVFHKTDLIVSSIDGHIRTFDMRMGSIMEDNLNIGIVGFGLSNDQRLITTSCLDSKIRILERDTGQILTVLQGSHKTEQYTIQCKFSWDDGQVLTGSDDGNVVWYDMLSGKVLRTHQAHQKSVSGLDFSAQRNAFVTGSYDGTAVFWSKPLS